MGSNRKEHLKECAKEDGREATATGEAGAAMSDERGAARGRTRLTRPKCWRKNARF